ncbi:hypothetical protein S83_027699 [Arachis hypogaea]
MVYPMGLKPIPVPTPGSPPPRPPPPPPDWPPPRRRRGPPPRRRPGPPPRPNLLPYHTDLLGYHSNAFQGIKKNPMYTSHLVGYYPYYDYQPYIPFLVPSTTSNHYTHTSTPPALISMQDTIEVLIIYHNIISIKSLSKELMNEQSNNVETVKQE